MFLHSFVLSGVLDKIINEMVKSEGTISTYLQKHSIRYINNLKNLNPVIFVLPHAIYI